MSSCLTVMLPVMLPVTLPHAVSGDGWRCDPQLSRLLAQPALRLSCCPVPRPALARSRPPSALLRLMLRPCVCVLQACFERLRKWRTDFEKRAGREVTQADLLLAEDDIRKTARRLGLV